MNPSKVVGTHPFAKASLTASAEKPQEGFRVYCGDIKTPRPVASHITLQLHARILPHALTSPSGFSLTDEAKKLCESVSHLPPSGGNHCKRTGDDLGVEAGLSGQSRLPAGFRVALLCKMRGSKGPSLQCRYLKVAKVK